MKFNGCDHDSNHADRDESKSYHLLPYIHKYWHPLLDKSKYVVCGTIIYLLFHILLIYFTTMITFVLWACELAINTITLLVIHSATFALIKRTYFSNFNTLTLNKSGFAREIILCYSYIIYHIIILIYQNL